MQNKKELVYDAVRKSELYNPDKIQIEPVANDILRKSCFIFEIGASENEIFDYLVSMADTSIKNIMEDTKGKDLQNNYETTDSVPDPKTIAFDISDEAGYLKKLLSKLYKLDTEKPDKKYAAIFYEKYIQKSSPENIAKKHNITVQELNSRLIDIAKAANEKK